VTIVTSAKEVMLLRECVFVDRTGLSKWVLKQVLGLKKIKNLTKSEF